MALQFPEYGIMALGLMPIMITAGIDLSCVGIANLTGILCALTLQRYATEDASTTTIVLVLLCVLLLANWFTGALKSVGALV